MAEELDLDKPDKETAERQREIADLFNTASSVVIEFEGHQYNGEVSDMKIGEYILFRVKNVDDGLVRLPKDFDDILFRLISVKGEAKSYPTELINKNIPHLLLKFPEKEVAPFVRKAERQFMSIDAPVVLEERGIGDMPRITSGLGTVKDLSENGCSLFTGLGLESGDKVRLFLDISERGRKNVVDVAGIVRRAGKPGDIASEIGIEFVDVAPEVMDAIRRFIKHHPSRSER